MKHLLYPAFILGLGLPLVAQKIVVLSHDGATDPTTEGFANTDPGNGVTTGAVVDDLGTGLDAWFVDDNSLANGSAIIYRSDILNSSDLSDALTRGWSLATNLRMVEGSTGFFPANSVSFFTGSSLFSMTFDVENDGDPTVILGGNSSFTLEGAGNQGYHLYELIYDPTENSADLFVDGVERISDFRGTASTLNARVNFGGNASNGTGRGHFNSVEFAIVPEPSSSLLIGFGMAAGLLRRRRS